MGLPHQTLEKSDPLGEAELKDWEEAYIAVEAYFQALRLRNRLVVSDLVSRVLHQATARHALTPEIPPRLLAMEEALSAIAQWTQEVLNEPLEHGRMAARGRLALLLAGMPGQWQNVFLTPAPWPPDFVEAMQKSYLAAGPQFSQLTMQPRPLELNAFGTGAAQWWQTMDRKPIMRRMVAVTFLLLIASVVWFIFY